MIRSVRSRAAPHVYLPWENRKRGLMKMRTRIAACLLAAVCGCSQEPEPQTGTKNQNLYVNSRAVAPYVTLVETNLADGVRCVVVYSHGPSPGTAVACDWRGK